MHATAMLQMASPIGCQEVGPANATIAERERRAHALRGLFSVRVWLCSGRLLACAGCPPCACVVSCGRVPGRVGVRAGACVCL